ncbi:MAG: short chain dehydrogenase [Spirochaetales bacterium]|jgi:NAD(P)-dependent dehydrogenase (short-subunit alcohol dehydrogenase family)|nr:short chain dehydrogenase [Spirochaetales bacterium]
MKILVIGAGGTIGQAVARLLSKNHDVLHASRSGEIRVDMTDPQSIISMYKENTDLDAVVSAAGTGKFGPLDQISDEDFDNSLKSKLMGQINLVRYGREYLNERGSFTLNSGILAHQQGSASVVISILNAGIEAFIYSASQDMPNGQRLNGVCPPMVRETGIKMGWGQGGMPADEVAVYYAESVEGSFNGKMFGPLHK